MANALRLLLLSIVLLLVACRPSLVNYETQAHVVRPGETLYTIAWRYGVDFRDLARWNRLDDPDLIFAGQRLRLRPTTNPTAVARSAGNTASSSRPGAAVPNRQPARLPAPAILPAPVWDWPTQGTLGAGFGSREGIGTGISLTGSGGQQIVAAADGRVVYVGTGLAGYGQLVIIKHNDTYLSAYGHTEAVAVTQGQAVKRGQRIAAMGLGPRRQAQLHFEIRRNGSPIDPLSLLPRRS